MEDEQSTDHTSRGAVLRWAAASGDSNEKLKFLREFLSCLNAEESRTVRLISMHIKRKKLKGKGKEEAEEAMNTVLEPVSAASPVGVAEACASEPVSEPLTWFKNWKNDNFKNVFAVDIEKVTVKQDGLNVQVAGTVTIVDFDGKVVKEWVVHHEPGTFLINEFTKAVNGFDVKSFELGKPIDLVRTEVAQFMESKLWILVDAGDFASLKLKANEHAYFDLQMEYWTYIIDGFIMRQWAGHSLESIYQHCFASSLQKGTYSATNDAIGAMKIFRECYISSKNTNMMSKYGTKEYKQISRVKSVAKLLKEQMKKRKFQMK